MKFKKFGILLSAAAVAMIATVFSGCDLFATVEDINIPAKFEADWEENITQAGQDVAYTHSETVNLADDPEVAKVIQKLKNVKLEKVTYRVENYVGGANDVILKNVEVAFLGSNGNAIVTVSGFGDVNLKTTTSDVNLGVSQQDLDFLAGFLKDEKQLTVKVFGTFSSAPVSFKMIFTIHTSITAALVD